MSNNANEQGRSAADGEQHQAWGTSREADTALAAWRVEMSYRDQWWAEYRPRAQTMPAAPANDQPQSPRPNEKAAPQDTAPPKEHGGGGVWPVEKFVQKANAKRLADNQKGV